MPRPCHFLSVAILAAAALAQSPLTTLFAGNNAVGPNSAVYFDLQVSVAVQVTQLDVNLSAAAGANGTIDLYTTPGTWVGHDSNPAAWTRLGGGQVVAAGVNLHSTVPLGTALPLAPGSYGVAVVYTGNVGPEYTNGTGSNQSFQNAELAITAGASGGIFTGAVNNPRVWNGAIHYSQAGNLATFRSFGSGCYDRPISFYEAFAAGTFDLGGNPTRSIVLQPNGVGGYAVSAGSSSFRQPTTPDLQLGDDDVSLAQPLPFTLRGPGFTANAVYVGSNGRLWLSGSYDTLYAPSASGLLTAGPSLCPLWTDLDPTAAGSIHAEVDAPSGVFTVTWLGVAQYGVASNTNTFQVELAPDGRIELRWRGVATQNAALVGFSQGASAPDPGGRDLSQLPFDTGPGGLPPRLWCDARPVLGQSLSLHTVDLPASAVVGVLELGVAGFEPGIDLSPLGMPGCAQYARTQVPVVQVAAAAAMRARLAIPNAASLQGLHVFAQSFVVATGFNALGVLASNGLDLGLGN